MCLGDYVHTCFRSYTPKHLHKYEIDEQKSTNPANLVGGGVYGQYLGNFSIYSG